MKVLHRLAVLGSLGAVLLAAAAVPASAAEWPDAPSPGAAEIGDRLFPGLGNGGYDVLHYHLDLRYATSDPAQPIDGRATIVARATQSLSRFNLDFAGLRVGDVSVDHRTAGWRREGEELVVTPRRPVRDRQRVRRRHASSPSSRPRRIPTSTRPPRSSRRPTARDGAAAEPRAPDLPVERPST